jgi:hypothetical protein
LIRIKAVAKTKAEKRRARVVKAEGKRIIAPKKRKVSERSIIPGL